MTLQWNPPPQQQPFKRTGAEIADQIGQNLNTLGQTFGRNRQLDEQRQRQELQERIQRYQLGQEYGTEGLNEIFQPRPAKKSWRSLFQGNQQQGMDTGSTPSIQPMTPANLTNGPQGTTGNPFQGGPAQFAAAGVADTPDNSMTPGQPGFDENAYARRFGTKRLGILHANEDRTLDRRFKQSQIDENEAQAANYQNPSPNYQKGEYLDSNGRARIGRFNPRTGRIDKSDSDEIAPQTARGETAGNLRKEFIDRPEVKDFVNVSTNVRSMDALLKGAVSGNQQNKVALDQAIVTLYNKLSDPSSVVRESEYARTPENLPLVNRIQGAIQKVQQGGAGLTDDDRKALVVGAKIIANERGNTYTQTRSGYVGLAKQMSLDPTLITATMPDFSPYDTSDGGGGGNRLSKQQRNRSTGQTRTVFSDDGGNTWHP